MMRSVQGGGIQTGGGLPCLDEVSQDLEDLRGVGDDGEDFHRLVTARAAQGVRRVDLLDQAGLCGPLCGPWAWMVAARPSWLGGAAVLGRHGELGLRLLGRADAEGGFEGMIAFPSLGSEADQVRVAGPPSRRASAPAGPGVPRAREEYRP